MAPYQVAIERVKKLFKERSDPGFWAQNIMDASRDIPPESKHDWARFYSYITNPTAFDPDGEFVTMDDLTQTLPDIPSYDECLEEIRYQNGPFETHIHVKRREASDDEKVPE